MEENIVIKVENVYKDFRLPHEKATTIKSKFVNLLKGRSSHYVERQHALRDISLEVKKGEFFGIVGRNGSGKSTLLKILAGIYQPTRGSTVVRGKLVPFIELGVGFNPELTGRENVYLNGALLGFSKAEIDKMYHEIVGFAELEPFMDQKLKNYSSGMQVRLAFSMAIRAQADILLVDEVLAVGDADFQRKCFNYFRELKRSKKTVVFVSHDMNAVREYCDRAALINKAKVIATGPATKIATHYMRMFSEVVVDKTTEPTKKKIKRWGDGTVRLEKVVVSPSIIREDTKEVVVSMQAVANQPIDNLTFGFIVKNAAGTHILGTNTQIKQQKIGPLRKGQRVKVEWRTPNIFADGRHYIDSAVHLDDVTVYDWWEDAAQFTAYKPEHTPHLVQPSIELVLKK